tara:strand:- start:900 stop:1160 length:261 start_codon:yes stop_codon:yes gene_type:complete
MAKSQHSGAKYANGNYKSQQKAYNKTAKGTALRVNANRLNRQLGTYGNGDGKDAAHYKGSTTKGRLQSPSKNRASRLKIRTGGINP